MLNKLGDILKQTLNKLAGAIFIDKQLIDNICKELQRSLYEADVDVKIVQSLIDKIKKESQKNIPGIDKKEHLIKLIYDEIVKILGDTEKEVKIDKKKRPSKILLVGLYGCGKTTTAAKLAFYYGKRGFKTCLLGLDVHRPAASEQLEQLSKKFNLSYLVDKEEKKAINIFKKFENKLKQYDLVIVDTAGRDVLNKELINEISELYRIINPDFVFLVIPADIGKVAAKQAQEFKKACLINGVIITRMDGTARGGGALASCAETGANVLFIGTGEKIHDIETFDPRSFVSRLLGMGDIRGLLEKTRLAIEEKEQKKMKARLDEGKFTLSDLYDQLKAMQNIGPLDQIASMIPGIGNLKIKTSDVFQIQENKMKRWKYAIDSMTLEERENPELLNSSRIARISKGSNVPTSEIRELIKQYRLIKDLIFGANQNSLAQLSSGKIDKKTLQKLAKKFGRRLF